MSEEKKLPPPSPIVEKLRDAFAPWAASLKPDDEPAVIYRPESEPE